jgi:hypothetical protein
MSTNWGSVPDWVAAVGTAGSLFYIAVQHQIERRKDREQRDEEVKDRRDREASQARLVSVAAGWGFDLGRGYTVRITVRNDSPSPIRHAQAVIEDPASGNTQIDAERSQSGSFLGLLASGASLDAMLSPMNQPGPPTDGYDRTGYDQLKHSLRVGVEFTDARGLRWLQIEEGVPLLRRQPS